MDSRVVKKQLPKVGRGRSTSGLIEFGAEPLLHDIFNILRAPVSPLESTSCYQKAPSSSRLSGEVRLCVAAPNDDRWWRCGGARGGPGSINIRLIGAVLQVVHVS